MSETPKAPLTDEGKAFQNGFFFGVLACIAVAHIVRIIEKLLK